MNIPKNLADTIKQKIAEALKKTNIELEALYTGEIDSNKFKNLVKYLRKNSFKELSQTTALDINQKGKRLTIEGNDHISAFCTSKGKKIPENSTIIEKITHNKIALNKLHDVFAFRLNMKSENKVENHTFNFNESSTFRLKKRLSFTSQQFQIDLTIVRQFEGTVDNFNTKINSSEEKREIEIELVQPVSKPDSTDLTNELLKNMHVVLCVLQNSTIVIGEKMISNVKDGYKKMLNIQTNNSSGQNFFLSYKPVTLEISNLDNKCVGVPGNIYENYAVTEKADGDRMALFIFESKVFLINDRFEIKYTGLNDERKLNDLNYTLIDGEFIKKGSDNQKLELFLGFDIYFHKNEDVRHLPFIAKDKHRYKLVKDTLKKIDNMTKTTFEFKTKEFQTGNNIVEMTNAIKDILHTKLTCRYKTDGLIFQPTNLGCGKLYLNQKNTEISKPRHLSIPWNRVYKWKPPSENTIDCMIVIPKIDVEATGSDKLTCELRVHNNYENIPLRSIMQILNNKYLGERKKPFVTFATQDFSTSDLKKVQSGEIWEFNFIKDENSFWTDQKNNKCSGQWKFHRKRDDKTSILRSKNTTKKNVDEYELGGSANAVKTANSVYSTIIHPITKDMIAGDDSIPAVEMDSQYYVNSINRDDRLIVPMSNFHSFIKDRLIAEYGGKNKHLVDVACGKGGDIFRYTRAGYNSVLGFDISFDGIFGDNDSAWTRYLNSQKSSKQPKPPPMMFLPRDMGKALDNFDDLSNKNKMTEHESDFHMISKYIIRDDNENYDFLNVPTIKKKLDFFKNKVQHEKFDVVSCQFALHYFFENEKTLDTFCNNVNNLLKKGGYFIATCFDGVKVDEEFKQAKRIEGKISDNVVWRIDKAYDTFKKETCGLAIDVFVESIGQSRREYLVDIELLKKKLENFTLTKKDSFKKFFVEKFNVKGETKTMNTLDPALQTYSGMNMVLVFEKEK